MASDDRHLINLDELADVLGRYSGPDRPRSKPDARTSPRIGLRGGAVLTGTALLVGSALGFGVASTVTPSGHAAPGLAGVGFVPESGWTVVQSGADALPQRPAVAIASNGPLNEEDAARGSLNSSGLPYATLLDLPPRGIVLVATFSRLPFRAQPFQRYPEWTLPLRLRDASPFQYGTQIRPQRPLGEYELRARVKKREVVLQVYFGTQHPSKATIAAAQRQLDRMFVEPAATAKPEQVAARALPLRTVASSTPATAAVKVADRTVMCTPGLDPIPVFTISSSSGRRRNGRMERLGQLSIWTRGDALPRHTQDYRPTLVGATGGWPPPARVTSGGVGADLELCKLVRTSVPFTKRGMTGGRESDTDNAHKCFPPKTVYIRFRAVFHTTGTVKFDAKRTWIGAIGRIDKTQIAVRAPNGRPLVYGEVLDSGRVNLFVEPNTCF